MRVCQDGAQFYSEDSGELVYTSPQHVTDIYDMRGAELARVDFLAYALAELGLSAHQIEFC